MTVPLQNPPTLACAGALSRSTLPGAWLKASMHAGSHHVASQPGIASSRMACALSTVLVAIHTWTALSIHGLKARPDTVMIASEPLAARAQALSSNKPYPSGVGGSGIALASDGSVALLSGSPATATAPANAFLFSFYTSANQYNSCPQQISVRLLASPSATAPYSCPGHTITSP